MLKRITHLRRDERGMSFVFIGMGSTVLTVVQGPPSPAAGTTTFRDSFWRTAPMLAALVMVVIMGLWIPAPVYDLVQRAAKTVGGAP